MAAVEEAQQVTYAAPAYTISPGGYTYGAPVTYAAAPATTTYAAPQYATTYAAAPATYQYASAAPQVTYQLQSAGEGQQVTYIVQGDDGQQQQGQQVTYIVQGADGQQQVSYGAPQYTYAAAPQISYQPAQIQYAAAPAEREAAPVASQVVYSAAPTYATPTYASPVTYAAYQTPGATYQVQQADAPAQQITSLSQLPQYQFAAGGVQYITQQPAQPAGLQPVASMVAPYPYSFPMTVPGAGESAPAPAIASMEVGKKPEIAICAPFGPGPERTGRPPVDANNAGGESKAPTKIKAVSASKKASKKKKGGCC